MGDLEAHDPKILRSYEGLIFATARRYSPYVEAELEDIQQDLRVAVFKALLSYDGTRTNALARDRYVFSCMKNRAKDLLKKRPRNESYIEDIAPGVEEQAGIFTAATRDWFEAHVGMASTHEQVYGRVEDDDVLVPNTLTDLERRIVCLLYADYRQAEVARSLGIAKGDMERAMRSIRRKMSDWRPTGEVVVIVTDELALAA